MVPRAAPRFGPLLPSAFAFPFSGRGLLSMAACGLLIALAGLRGWGTAVLPILAVLAYLFLVVRTSANGARDVPAAADFPGMLDAVASMLRFVLAAAVTFLPLFLYARVFKTMSEPSSYLTDPRVYITALPGLVLVPMTATLAETDASLAAVLNPLAVARFGFRIASDYVLAVVVFWALIFGAILLKLLGYTFVDRIPLAVVWRLYAGVALMYFPMVVARVLGLLLLARGADLEYGAYEQQFEPVLGSVRPANELPPAEPAAPQSVPFQAVAMTVEEPAEPPALTSADAAAPAESSESSLPHRESDAPVSDLAEPESRFEVLPIASATQPSDLEDLPRSPAIDGLPVETEEAPQEELTELVTRDAPARTPASYQTESAVLPDLPAPVTPEAVLSPPLTQSAPSVAEPATPHPADVNEPARTMIMRPHVIHAAGAGPDRDERLPAVPPESDSAAIARPSPFESFQNYRATGAVPPGNAGRAGTEPLSRVPFGRPPPPPPPSATSLSPSVSAGAAPSPVDAESARLSRPPLTAAEPPQRPSGSPSELTPAPSAYQSAGPPLRSASIQTPPMPPPSMAPPRPPPSPPPSIPPPSSRVPSPASTDAPSREQTPMGPASMAPPRGASGVAVPTDAEIRVLASSGQYGTLAAAYRARMGAVTILSADELRFTADAALRMSDFQTASHALKRIGYDHSTSPHAPDALLQGGILIGRELRRPADGQKLLRHLIQSYPQSPAAEQARRLLGVTQ